MKSFWANLPEQIKRLAVVVILSIVIFIVIRSLLIPSDFGKYGHYRASSLEDIAGMETKYAGHQVCYDCHDDIVDTKHNGYHKNVACEVCHGPAEAHIEGEEVELRVPRGRGFCPLCHEYLPSRPTGFPQIIAASHNPMKACIECHNPHDPTPPQTPKECSACHAEIANTKSLSKHVYVPCTRCHETPDEHKLRPRAVKPSKPQTREFCGGCHSIDADTEKNIPRIDLTQHNTRYVCWQCHYPHLPETE
ncbi:MAG: hypothetical protein P8Y99_09420 [Calditrichaceae bacterium]